jgi:hypothetical protein
VPGSLLVTDTSFQPAGPQPASVTVKVSVNVCT